MFSATTLRRKLRPHGLTPEIQELPRPAVPGQVLGRHTTTSDRRWYRATLKAWTLSEVFAECQVDFSLPVPDDRGVFDINGLSRYIIKEGFLDLHRCQVGKPLQFIFRKNTTVLLRALNQIFHGGLTEFFMTGQAPSQDDIQAAIDNWFLSAAVSHTVDGTNPIQLKSLQEMVYLRVPDNSLDLTLRQFPTSMWNILDPSSTPQGVKVNLSYRMTKGATVLNGNPVRSEHLFCSTTQDLGIAGSLTPRRMQLMRSSFEHSLPLVEYEDPLVGNPGLPGRHLLTAIMNYRSYTGEDAIVVSESAARKMRAIRICVETLHLTGNIHLKVKEGDEVMPGSLLAEAVDPLTGKTQDFRSLKMTYPSTLTQITTCHSTVAGVSSIKVRFHFRADIPIETGDKLFTRSAIKGVAFVLPDSRMPVTEDGRTIEICVSPESVINRVAMTTFWEMMANDYKMATGNEVSGDHENPSPSFEELVKLGYGAKQQLSIKDTPLAEQTFCGRTFFLRIDKLARETATGHDGMVALNGQRLPVDNARMNGQRRGMAAGMTMLARDLRANFLYLLRDNLHGRYAAGELIRSLRPVFAEPEDLSGLVVDDRSSEFPLPAGGHREEESDVL